jgi:hypothetical protein
MGSDAKKATPATAHVYICPCDAGFILSVGPVCLWLERATAEDVLANLRDALCADSRTGAPGGARPDDGDDSN